MAFVVKDRVKVASTTTGTGTFTLGSAAAGFQDFSVIGDTNTTYYTIVDGTSGDFEVGIGVYGDPGSTLSRDTVLESSTGGAKINFAAGAKDVFVTYPAETSVTDLGISRPNIRPSLNLDFANVKALDPRITFARASAATYYGTDTAKAEENLFRFSQEFDNSYWTKNDVAVTANTEVAPNGTTTAETITASATTANHDIDPNNSSVVRTISGLDYVFSVFAKKGTHDYFQICVLNQFDVFANFDLDLGVLGTNGGTITQSITSVGNDWYRCVVVFNCTGTTQRADFALVTSDSAVRRESWTALGTETILIWGAQMEQRDAVTAYTPTTTQPITNYIPVLESAAAGEARFDHNPVTGESLGLLIEESRTNRLLRSEEFDNAGWFKLRSSIVANTIVAPSGELTGDKLVEDTTASNTHFCARNATLSVASTVTASLYVKAAERTHINLRVISPTSPSEFVSATFDLSNGTFTTTIGNGGTGVAASMTAVGNGWHRVVVSGLLSTKTNPALEIRLADASGSTAYTGDGFSGIFIWGASLEQGAFPTSYVKTTTAQVTRAADAASMTGANFSSWFNQAEGGFYAEFSTVFTGSASFPGINPGVFAVTDAASAAFNGYGIRLNPVTFTSSVRWGSRNGATLLEVATAFTGFIQSGTIFKNACVYASNLLAQSVNGGAAVQITDSNYGLMTLNRLEIGFQRVGGTTTQLNGHIRKISYYPKRIANDQLQGLTT